MLSKYEPRRQQLPIQIVEANIRDSRYSVTSLVPYEHLVGGNKGQTMALTRKFLVRANDKCPETYVPNE